MIKRAWRMALLAGFTMAMGAPTSVQCQGAGNKLSMVLPLELTAAQPATFAVTEPDGHLAAGVKLVLSNGETATTDESGRAHFLAPPDTGVMFARIVGTEVREAAEVLPASARSLEITSLPRLASAQDKIVIRGSGFQGDADRNHVDVKGKAAFVLAASPRELIVEAPENADPGAAMLTLSVGRERASAEITLVKLEVENPAEERIQRDRKSKLTLRVVGTQDPLELEVRNLVPEGVRFAHGDERKVRTSGGTTNVAILEMKGKSEGPFSFSARLQEGGLSADTTIARGFLEKAKEIAPRGDASRIRRLLKAMDGGASHSAKALDELQRIPRSAGSEDFQALVRAARRAFQGE